MTDWDFYQLNALDSGNTEVAFTTSWLVQGRIDLEKLSAALDVVTDRWRLLAGRLELSENTLRVRFPRGDFPKDYRRYALTTAVSKGAVSDYVTLPLPTVSPLPPLSLSVPPAMPTSARDFAKTQHPLISIHITTLEDSSHSFVGFTVPHGVFDATGTGFVHRALEAQLHGREWEPPVYPYALNPILEAHTVQPLSTSFYSKFKTAFEFIGRMFYDTYWDKVKLHLVVVPEAVHLGLVKQVRDSLDIPVGASDVLAAWLFKTMYSNGAPASRTVQFVTFCSFRSFIPDLATYPHNAFVRAFCPQTTVGELVQRSLAEIAVLIYESRQALGMKDVLAAHDELVSGSLLDMLSQGGDRRGADEIFWVNNCSAAKATELNWPGVEKVEWASRYMLNGVPFQMANFWTIMGRLDGDLMIHIAESKEKLALIEGEIRRLAAKK
ncbi:hypothetical protein FB45DRAFT_1028532 [Roridomyces roridus]|uniref:Uncharacterized protein n=1 Tax=Roridomyces roridus TaxID=1738132 RepID=A0AAD7BQY6_9AGAR|nr:hypothetical protein FB45DRAFT_1028532 [Roridomyces roridus]